MSSWFANMQTIQAPPSAAGTLFRELSGRPIVDEDRHDGDEFTEEDTAGGGGAPRPPRSPCEISNDPGVSDTVAPLSTCGVTEYRCGTDSDMDGPERQLDFYYDVYTTNNSGNGDAVVNATRAVAYVEERMLMELAEILGVDDCRMIFAERRHRRQLLRGLQSNVYPGAVGIKTAPKDEILQNSACTSSYSSSGTSGSNNNCIPVLGGFTVLGDFTLTESLYEYVEELARNDTLVGESLLIDKVVYVGRRPDTENGDNNAPVEQVVGDDTPSPRNGSSTGGTLTSTTKTLIGVAAGLAAVLLLVLLAVRRKRRSKQNEAAARQVVVLEEAELDFDVTPDTMSPEGLAVKDSLALVPQDEYPGEEAIETQVNLARLYQHIDVLAEGSDDFVRGRSGGSSAEEDDIYISTTDPSTEDDMFSNERGGGTTATQPHDAVSVELHVHEDDFVVGAALSRIEESSTQDDDLAFLEALSASSYDTRQSARRTLQMT